MKICSPQLEKGHTRIANELLEAIIIYPFNATELKVILTIIRKTYGWKQKTAYMSYGLIAKLTGIDKRYIIRVLNKLTQDKVILKEKTGASNILGLNKCYLQWKLWITLDRGGQQTTAIMANRPLSSEQPTTISDGLESPILNKEINIYKENIKEKTKFSFFPFFKPKKHNFKEYLKEPIHVKEIIKSII